MKKKLILIFVLFHWLSILFAQRLEIHQINVGVGSATLILAYRPDNTRATAILIDAGRPGAGNDSITNYLNRLDPNFRLTAVYATHYDNDHIGGFVGTSTNPGILWSTFVDSTTVVYDRGTTNAPDTDTYAYYNAAANGFTHATLTASTSHPLYTSGTTTNNIFLNILAVNGVIGGTNHNVDNENDLSAVMLVSFNGFNFFIGGDLSGTPPTTVSACSSSTTSFTNTTYGTAVTNALAPYPLTYGGALMTHHGADNTYTGFINSAYLTPPLFALISSGKQGHYQHPRPDPLNLLYAAGIMTYITAANLYSRATNIVGGTATGTFVNGNIVVVVHPNGSIFINGNLIYHPPLPRMP